MANTVYYPAETRGDSNIGWLHGRHSFSIGPFFDPNRMAFGALKVLNDDIVQPRTGFGTHGHDNIEIISIPLTGSITHKDDTGKEASISPGEVQVMSAGTGIRHSEYNDDDAQPINFLQIWIYPNKRDVAPRYQQVKLDPAENRLQQIVSPGKDDDGVWIHQEAWLHKGTFTPGEKLIYNLKRTGNGAYVFVISGKLKINGQSLKNRDAIAISDTNAVTIEVVEKAEFIVIDVPVN